MNQYPVFFNLAGKPVLLAGGGETVLRKARLLKAANARLSIFSSEPAPALLDEMGGRAEFLNRNACQADFEGMTLAIIAEDDVNRCAALASMARHAGVPVNVVDKPELCDFTTPSIVDRGDVVVAISTGGKAPVYGRSLRARIECMLPQRLDALIHFAGTFRDAVRARFGERARQFWERFFDGPIAAQILNGEEPRAREAMLRLINDDDTSSGVVHIVGAGPGDPELLTMRAHRLLQMADVIVYDRLVSGEILALARRDADRVYVGKAKANHAVPQDQIHTRMIALAREGKTVVRLKGGDPFIFGRGGEELDALREAGIPAYITPGITAATGCAASAGMALSHRDHAQAITFVTGHAQNGEEPALDWRALAAANQTVVVYMGVGTAAAITQKMMAHGRAGTTPVAVIENGTRPDEIIAKGQLDSLPQLIDRFAIKGPALLVIGDVAALAVDRPIPTIGAERLSA